MLLRVQYNTRKYDMVKETLLDGLIASGRIVKFCRSTGWVVIGRDPIRGQGGSYDGLERRRPKETAVA